MRRREFIAGLAGAATWPLTAWAQQGERVRRIGILMGTAEDEDKTLVAAFEQGLHGYGWMEGRNVRIDYRWSAGNTDRIRANVAELLSLKPDVVLVFGSRVLAAMQQATRIVPLVFVASIDPVAGGFVPSYARPGSNITGFSVFEFSMITKMVEALKQIAPQTARIAFIFHSDNPDSTFFMKLLETAAPSFAVRPIAAPVGDVAEIERAIENLARDPSSGLLAPPDIFLSSHRELIVQLATLHRLPALYSSREFPTRGGLVSYGSDRVDLF
jgi:putative tryptophan/tyrosine transport system substrate-binding protein